MSTELRRRPFATEEGGTIAEAVLDESGGVLGERREVDGAVGENARTKLGDDQGGAIRLPLCGVGGLRRRSEIVAKRGGGDRTPSMTTKLWTDACQLDQRCL